MSYAKGKESEDDLLETFKGWFKQVADVEAGQRIRETEDLRSQVGEFQWDPKARAARMGQDGATARPTLSVSLTKQPMQLVKNQAANADLGVEIHAVSEKSDKDVAEAQQGLYRRIERDSNAALARLWAFDRAVQCGRGWYQIVAQYDEDGDNEYDQELSIKRILDGSCVGVDPAAQEPDFSDARWAYLDEWMSLDAFRDEYSESAIAGLSPEDFTELCTTEPAWVMGGDTEKKAVRVPQVWRKKITRTKVHLVRARTGEQADERGYATVPDAELGRRKSFTSKTRVDVTLCWYRVTAKGILDSEEYEGLRLIPLIPVIWNELQPFDGERRYEGMQRPAADGQKGFNFAISAAVEDVGRLSKVPYVGPAGAFAGHEEKWNTINIKNWSFVEYNLMGTDGQPIQRPEPMPIDGTKLGLSLQLAEMCKGLVQSATAVYDPSLGKTEGQHESGRKVIALQQQADAGTSNGIFGLARMTMNYESRVVRERFPYYYDRPGRVVQILGEEDKERTVMLNAHFNMGEDGRPQRVVGRNVQGAKILDFTKGGKYSTAVSVGKSYQTKMQEGQAVWAELMPNLPPEAQVILLPTVMRFMDTPGANDAADLMAKFRDAKFPGLVDDEENGPTPEQLKAKLSGMQQQMQEQGQQLQLAIQEIKTDQAKQQAAMAKAQLDAATTLHKAQMDNAARIEVARIGAAKQSANQEAEAQEELLATGIKVQHEAEQNALDREHEREMKHEDMAHDVGMAKAGGTTMNRHMERGQEGEQERSQDTSQGTSKENTESAETLPPEPQADGAGE